MDYYVPTFWIIAGANGAGKTTVARQFLDSTITIFNPDEYAKDTYGDYSFDSLAKGARDIIRIIHQRIRTSLTKSSFAIETTFSGKMHLRLMKEAASHGWNVGFLYIGTDHYQKNIHRVSERIQKGGHYVSPTDIERRYYKSIQNIKAGLHVADIGYIFDNSSLEITLIVSKKQDHISLHTSELPGWLKQHNFSSEG